MKTCLKCGEEKPLDNFSRDKSAKDGLQHYCQPCGRAENKLWREKNPEKRRTDHRRWGQKNPEKILNTRLQCLYGISLSSFIQMAIAQNAQCAICGTQGKLCVDHDHKTGKVRKLICGSCNSFIGLAKESPTVLQRAISYLQDHA